MHAPPRPTLGRFLKSALEKTGTFSKWAGSVQSFLPVAPRFVVVALSQQL